MLCRRRLRRHHPRLGSAGRCPRVQPRLSNLPSSLCPARDLAALLGVRTRHLQWEPDRRPRPLPECVLPGVPGLRPGGLARSYQPDFAALATDETISEIPLKSNRVTDWALLAEGLARDPDPDACSSEPPSRPGVDRSGIQPSLDSYAPLDQFPPRMASGDNGCYPDRRGRAAVLWRFVLHAGLAARCGPSRPVRSRAGCLSPQSRAAPPFEQAR